MRILLIILFLGTSILANAQDRHFRVKAEFSIKEKRPDGSLALQVGTAYYDLTIGKLVYDVRFPRKHVVVSTDSLLFEFNPDGSSTKLPSPGFLQQSIFHLCLSGDLKDFGLSSSPLKIESVEQDQGMVITTYRPERITKRSIFKGKILTSAKDRKLFGVVIQDENEEVLSKQFYENYERVSGVDFPMKVVYIVYNDGKEFYKVMEFKAVVINEKDNDQFYDYPLKP